MSHSCSELGGTVVTVSIVVVENLPSLLPPHRNEDHLEGNVVAVVLVGVSPAVVIAVWWRRSQLSQQT